MRIIKEKQKKLKSRKSIKEMKKDYHESNDNYYEAILQLRGFNEEQFNSVVDYIEKSQCKVTKHVEQKNGIDLYLFSQKFIQHLARWIKQNYNCQVVTSRKLHTRDTKANKDLYRVTVLVNFLRIKVGDVIEYDGERVRITSLGSKPVGRIVSTGKRIFLNPKLI